MRKRFDLLVGELRLAPAKAQDGEPWFGHGSKQSRNFAIEWEACEITPFAQAIRHSEQICLWR